MWTKRGKACLILIFSTNTNCENMAYRSFRSEKYSARGVRKVTTGITGLWQPSVHSDVAFWSFDVGSSYHWDAEVPKCRIVHPPIGNVRAGFRPSWDRLVLPYWWIWCCDSNRSQYERNTSFRYLVNVVSWKANTTKLPSVGLRVNASKSESMLAKQRCPPPSLWCANQ